MDQNYVIYPIIGVDNFGSSSLGRICNICEDEIKGWTCGVVIQLSIYNLCLNCVKKGQRSLFSVRFTREQLDNIRKDKYKCLDL